MMVGNQALISTLAVGIYVVKWCDVKCRSCSVFFMANTNLICGPLSFYFLFQFYFFRALPVFFPYFILFLYFLFLLNTLLIS